MKQNDFIEKICYCYWKGVKNYDELQEYLEETGDLPECEMFQVLQIGDEEMIKDNGFIEEQICDDEIFDEIPRTLTEALEE